MFLVTGGTPRTKLTGLVRKWNTRARIGPHMTPSNLLFLAHEGIQALQQNNKGRIICLTEQVVPPFEHWEREIEGMFGHKQKTTTDEMPGQAARDRLFFKSHSQEQLEKWNRRLWEETETEQQNNNVFFWKEDNGGKEKWSSWPHRDNAMERRPPTMKTYYPTLVLRNGNPEDFDRLLEWEKSFLRKMKIHGSKGEGFYAGPKQVATWMGLSSE